MTHVSVSTGGGVGKRRLSVGTNIHRTFYILLYRVYCWLPSHTSSQELARRLDTLHVVLSGQGYRPSKPKGLHTGFSGLPLIAVKGGPSYI
jgi:hypothetical protein